MRILSLLSLLLMASVVTAEELPKPSGDSIVPADAELEWLFRGETPIRGGFTGGLAVAPDGTIFFSHIPLGKDKGMILRCVPFPNKTEVFIEDSRKSNGLKFDAKGFLIACEGADGGGFCISRLGRMTFEDKLIVGSITYPGRRTIWTPHREEIAGDFDGKPFHSPNDLTIDCRGRIYFTDSRAVYRVDPKKGGSTSYQSRVSEVTHVPEKPIGIALSPDERTLYVADYNNGTDDIGQSDPEIKPGAMKVHAFPLDADGSVNGRGKVLIDFGKERGCDGITVDVKGNLYLAVRSLKRPGIWVIDKDGKELAYIPTGLPQSGAKKPKGIPSKCCFGFGAERNVLYITVDTGLCCIPLKVR